MIQATVGETWGSTVQQGCVDAMKSTPDQFSLHSHIRTTLQTLCLTFSVCLVTVRLSPSPCLGSHSLVLSPNVSPRRSLRLSAPWVVNQTPAHSSPHPLWVVYRKPAHSSPHPLHQNLLPLHCHRFLPFWLFLQQ